MPIARGWIMARSFRTLDLLLAIPLMTQMLGGGMASAQQPVRPLPKVGSCPLGYYSSGSYCVPGNNSQTRGAIEKVGGSCPLGFFSSGAYCLSGQNQTVEAILKQGNSCPLGWLSSANYCIRHR